MSYTAPLPYLSCAANYYAALADLPWAIWLDSGGSGRFDILVAQPYVTLVTIGVATEINDASGGRRSAADPFDLIREYLGQPSASPTDLPFSGGALGYWGYDLARRWVKLSPTHLATDPLPDMAIGIYDWAVVIDHQEKKAQLVSQLQQLGTAEELPHILARLLAVPPSPIKSFRITSAISSNFSEDEYAAAFDKIQNYLFAGDCYQVNLAQRFTVTASGDAYPAYLTLREYNPAPYSAYIKLPQGEILCSSPERFLSVRNGQVQTKPIKGTRPRGRDAEQDQQLKNALALNDKDRAENLMIVDLLRNDLSKACALGSIKVDKLFAVESYAHVHHLVSTISARLDEGVDALSLLRQCFPGGSITGAPKQRAMEIIDELEPQRRGVYCGAIGYIGWDGNMDTNIVIRTLIYANGKMHGSVGGGIVADSVAPDEYQETLDKAAGMFELFAKYAKK